MLFLSVHGALTLDFSQYLNVPQVSAGGRKRKRKRVLKSKMFIDDEEGCMGKLSSTPRWNYTEDVLKMFEGQPLPGLERGSQNHFAVPLQPPAARSR